jgi:hypothetical protein
MPSKKHQNKDVYSFKWIKVRGRGLYKLEIICELLDQGQILHGLLDPRSIGVAKKPYRTIGLKSPSVLLYLFLRFSGFQMLR